jgi:Zn-dependent protease
MGRAGGQGGPLFNALAFLVFLQSTALVLNLLPIPGLDGYGALRPFLPEAAAKALQPLEGIAALAFLGLLFFLPGVSALLFGVALLITDAVGVPGEAIQAGWDAFRFWA